MAGLSAPPVLSTPDNYVLTEIEALGDAPMSSSLSEEQFKIRYEIDRTVTEIRRCKWRKVALQFPDRMLADSARVFQLLARGIETATNGSLHTIETCEGGKGIDDGVLDNQRVNSLDEQTYKSVKLTILGDTSYGSCCVDEIAAEHVEADAVVHYGRTCLSPTSRLPVLYIFTQFDIDRESVIKAFSDSFNDLAAKVIVTADTPFAQHVAPIVEGLLGRGYDNTFAAEIIHDPSSIVPNRTVPKTVLEDESTLSEWHVFHISEPPTALLLTLSSKVASIYIYNIQGDGNAGNNSAEETSTARVLKRRYALVTSMSTVSTWGILINTLSVKNYLHVVEHVKKQIAAAGKKSYLFVVGKLNAAKVANFSEIGGWVVIGCWESSLIDSHDFYKPILTPFELELALTSDSSRMWTGQWRSDFQGVLDSSHHSTQEEQQEDEVISLGVGELNIDSEEESVPPEFDLRTGRYVSHTRPMAHRPIAHQTDARSNGAGMNALMRKMNSDIAQVNGVSSPAAEYLAQKRSWKGLGSDFEIRYDDEQTEGSVIEQGRSGVAGGYVFGDSSRS